MSLTAAAQQFGSTGTAGIPAIVPNGKLLEIYFLVTASNAPSNYQPGGDPLDLTGVLTNLEGFMISSSALALQVYIQSQSAANGHSGYLYSYRPGTTLKNGKMQVMQCGGAAAPLAELGGGSATNYPAAILADTIVGLAVLPIE